MTYPDGDRRRESIIKFIRQYRSDHGFSPNMREIADAVGLKSQATVKRHIDTLLQQGRVTQLAKTPRTLQVVEKPKPSSTKADIERIWDQTQKALAGGES